MTVPSGGIQPSIGLGAVALLRNGLPLLLLGHFGLPVGYDPLGLLIVPSIRIGLGGDLLIDFELALPISHLEKLLRGGSGVIEPKGRGIADKYSWCIEGPCEGINIYLTVHPKRNFPSPHPIHLYNTLVHESAK